MDGIIFLLKNNLKDIEPTINKEFGNWIKYMFFGDIGKVKF